MRAFLIYFEYEHYCQGYEWEWEYQLVYARDFPHACGKIALKFKNAREFQNKTIV